MKTVDFEHPGGHLHGPEENFFKKVHVNTRSLPPISPQLRLLSTLPAPRVGFIGFLETSLDGFALLLESHLFQFESFRLVLVLQSLSLATLSLQLRALAFEPESRGEKIMK